jgi:membrane-bound serine protease (ClpP class)
MRTKRFLRIGLATAAAAALGLAAPPAQAQSPGDIVRLRLNGVVDPFVADHIQREIADAQAAGAAAVLIDIDTPGGLLSSTREITQAILGADVPVITYVAPAGARAASAGAFVLLAGNVAAMAPGTNVGASTPVGLSGAVASEKAQADAAASIVSIAETRGRNAGVAETFVTEARSISAEQALSDDVIDLVSPSDEALLQQVDGRAVTLASGRSVTLATAGAPIVDIEMSPAIAFLHSLFDPDLAFIFFWLGLALLVLELIVPGHIFSGTIGTILLVLSIVSFGLLPVRLFGVLLLVSAVVFLVLELKAPGLGVWSVLGIAALVVGGLVLYDPAGGVRVSPVVIIVVAGFVALFSGFVVSKALKLRHLPPPEGAMAVVGKEGVVIGSGVTPADGVVRVAAEEWRAVAPNGPLPAGTPIRVTSLDGLVLTVEPINHEHVSSGVPADEGRRT